MNDYVAELTLDLDCRNTQPIIRVGQYDIGRKCLIHITADDQPYSASGCTAAIKGRRQDKTVFSGNCEINNSGDISLILTESMLAVRGFAYAKIVLIDSTHTYSTQMFVIDVDSAFVGEITDEESSVLNYYIRQLAPIIEEMPQISDIADAIEKRVKISDAYDKDKNSLEQGQIHIDDATAVDTLYRYKNSSGTNIGWLISAGLKSNTYKRIQIRFLGGLNSEISYRTIDYTTSPATFGAWIKFATASDLNNKVDKVTGKGLSSNDYTTAEKNKLSGIEAEANKTVVDSVLSSSSTNPVQNKIIKAALDNLSSSIVYEAPPAYESTYPIGTLFYYNGRFYKFISEDNSGTLTKKARYAIIGRIIVTNSSVIPGLFPLTNEQNVGNRISTFCVGDISSVITPSTGAEQQIGNDVYVCTRVNLSTDNNQISYYYQWKKQPFNATTLAEYGILDAYTKEEVDSLIPDISDKVDKVTGKGLSTNDFSTAEKNKLSGIETEANKTVVDSALSSSSTNPVQNKVVKAALDGISRVPSGGSTGQVLTKTANGTAWQTTQQSSGDLPLQLTPHLGLVDSRDLSLYGGSGYYHIEIPVSAGERYIISCRSSNSVYPGAFYTLNGVKVSAIFEDAATHTNAEITVPSGVDTLWLNNISTIIPLDQWIIYKILPAGDYCEANNSRIATLESERIDESIESMRRLKNLESLYTFRWKPFDKAYYCFVNDGSKSWLHVLYDVFHAHGAPLTAAVIGENIELANDTETTPGGRTVKQTLDAIVADGGEVMTYLNAAALSANDPFELWYDYAVRKGKHMIEAYGYRVRGLILSAQSARNSAVGQEICERFFDYSDRVGIKPQYNINRVQFSDTSTVADVKAYIDSTVGTPGFYPIMMHRPSQEPWTTYAGMDEILTYIEGKGSAAAISTYSAIFDTFGTNGFLTLSDLPIYNGGVQ